MTFLYALNSISGTFCIRNTKEFKIIEYFMVETCGMWWGRFIDMLSWWRSQRFWTWINDLVSDSYFAHTYLYIIITKIIYEDVHLLIFSNTILLYTKIIYLLIIGLWIVLAVSSKTVVAVLVHGISNGNAHARKYSI